MSQTMVAISGNTFPVRDELRRLGARWNPDSRTWSVPANLVDQAVKLVASAALQGTLRYSKRKPRRINHYGSYALGSED